MRVSLTKGMIAADFLGDPTGVGLFFLAAIAAVELFLQRVFVHGAVAVVALEVKARAADLLGQHQQIKHFGARRRVFASVRFEPAPVVMGDGTASADHPPEVPTSVAYAENHSRPVQSGNANQTTAPGVELGCSGPVLGVIQRARWTT